MTVVLQRRVLVAHDIFNRSRPQLVVAGACPLVSYHGHYNPVALFTELFSRSATVVSCLYNCGYAALIMSAPFSATMYTSFWMRQSGMTGKTDASMTRKLLTPWTRRSLSTTPCSTFCESRHVPHGSVYFQRAQQGKVGSTYGIRSVSVRVSSGSSPRPSCVASAKGSLRR